MRVQFTLQYLTWLRLNYVTAIDETGFSVPDMCAVTRDKQGVAFYGFFHIDNVFKEFYVKIYFVQFIDEMIFSYSTVDWLNLSKTEFTKIN